VQCKEARARCGSGSGQRVRKKLDIQRAVHVGVEGGEREAREGDALLKRRFIQSVVPSRALPGV
jgi:hypothetical protein